MMSNLPLTHLPLTLDINALARLLSPIIYLSISTIARNVTRCPESLPPFEELGGKGGKKIYVTQVVIDFYPPGIGASIRRALEREWEKKEGRREEISAANVRPAPPAMQSLAEILMPPSASAGRVC